MGRCLAKLTLGGTHRRRRQEGAKASWGQTVRTLSSKLGSGDCALQGMEMLMDRAAPGDRVVGGEGAASRSVFMEVTCMSQVLCWVIFIRDLTPSAKRSCWFCYSYPFQMSQRGSEALGTDHSQGHRVQLFEVHAKVSSGCLGTLR